MKSLSRIDMIEVTRLTREGRLGEAMQMLRAGHAAVAPDVSSEPRVQVQDRAPIIDMEPPSAANGGAWTAAAAASSERAAAAGAAPDRAAKPRIRVRRFATHGADPLPPGARFEQRVHGRGTGERRYRLYVPGSGGTPGALVVLLHGCTQSPEDFALGTRMNLLAEERGLVVAYPEQSQKANASKCWNWFNGADQRRGGGEPESIAGITRELMREFKIDPRRVHVAGLSAGGAMAAILGAEYPELFAAVGVHSGLARGAAHDVQSAFAAMRGGADGAMSTSTTDTVPTIVFHGDADTTVAPINGEQVMRQARARAVLHRQVQTGTSADGAGWTRILETSAAGVTTLEHWLLHGGGHAWSGGDPRGSFVTPRGPDASREMLRFFEEVARARGACA
ncbi:MAG TPA: PHB depolymerase family esterase [Dokdonella sp.]